MQFEELPDTLLVERVQAGESAAFGAIMRRYKQPVLNFVYRLIGNAAEAEDVAQDVFVRVYQQLHRYRRNEKFSTWLFACARHAAIDRLRWRERHPVESLEFCPTPRTTVTAFGLAATREIGELIATAIGELPEDQRTAIVLSEYHGLPDAEIAAVMRCSTKAVEQRLYRAKRTLRRELQHLQPSALSV